MLITPFFIILLLLLLGIQEFLVIEFWKMKIIIDNDNCFRCTCDMLEGYSCVNSFCTLTVNFTLALSYFFLEIVNHLKSLAVVKTSILMVYLLSSYSHETG